jgi:hypothetical protein
MYRGKRAISWIALFIEFREAAFLKGIVPRDFSPQLFFMKKGPD